MKKYLFKIYSVFPLICWFPVYHISVKCKIDLFSSFINKLENDLWLEQPRTSIIIIGKKVSSLKLILFILSSSIVSPSKYFSFFILCVISYCHTAVSSKPSNSTGCRVVVADLFEDENRGMSFWEKYPLPIFCALNFSRDFWFFTFVVATFQRWPREIEMITKCKENFRYYTLLQGYTSFACY